MIESAGLQIAQHPKSLAEALPNPLQVRRHVRTGRESHPQDLHSRLATKPYSIPSKFFLALQSFCCRLSVVLLSFDIRSTLIQLDRTKKIGRDRHHGRTRWPGMVGKEVGDTHQCHLGRVNAHPDILRSFDDTSKYILGLNSELNSVHYSIHFEARNLSSTAFIHLPEENGLLFVVTSLVKKSTGTIDFGPWKPFVQAATSLRSKRGKETTFVTGFCPPSRA